MKCPNLVPILTISLLVGAPTSRIEFRPTTWCYQKPPTRSFLIAQVNPDDKAGVQEHPDAGQRAGPGAGALGPVPAAVPRPIWREKVRAHDTGETRELERELELWEQKNETNSAGGEVNTNERGGVQNHQVPQ